MNDSILFMKQHLDRRAFILNATKAFGLTTLLASPSMSGTNQGHTTARDEVTVGQIIDRFISQVPGAPFPNTVDTLKAGSREMRVTGVVTTMFATIEVIRKAIALNANFIIAHEPTFYNHLDQTDWLVDDDVYRYKAALLRDHSITVWRNHDYIHSLKSDGVRAGLLEQLGWGAYYRPELGNVVMLPGTTLGALIGSLKDTLGISMVRYIGNPSQRCEKILLMPGASGGRNQITQLTKTKPDVLVCGELQEWETAEYVRDARAKGDGVALVVLGHIASEEAGSAFMVAQRGVSRAEVRSRAGEQLVVVSVIVREG
jgi:putative NIF3 family GTP cyclohydrolase 1 type 2